MSVFSKLRSLNLSGSSVGDKGVINCLKSFSQLKELDISNCALLTDITIKKISGEQLLNIKANGLNSVSEEALLSLIFQSYNLNYL